MKQKYLTIGKAWAAQVHSRDRSCLICPETYKNSKGLDFREKEWA